jgi:hypothetical protein
MARAGRLPWHQWREDRQRPRSRCRVEGFVRDPRRAHALSPPCDRKRKHYGHHEQAGPGLRGGPRSGLLVTGWVNAIANLSCCHPPTSPVASQAFKFSPFARQYLQQSRAVFCIPDRRDGTSPVASPEGPTSPRARDRFGVGVRGPLFRLP